MVEFWVGTEDEVAHHMGAMSPAWAPKMLMFPEQLDAYEKMFGSPVMWIASDRIDNVIWRRSTDAGAG